MKAVYSIAAKLGGSGIGTTAFQAVRGIYSVGVLDKVFCTSNVQSVVPSKLISLTNVSFWESLKFLPSRYQWFLKDLTHDLGVTLMLRSIKADGVNIFHVWNGHGLYSLRQAKNLGAKIVVERASSHPLTYEKIMQGEYRFRNLKFSQMLLPNKDRLLKELDEADYITAPSEFAFESLLENGVGEKRIIKIHYGVDLDLFRPAAGTGKSNKFRVIFVGQLGLRKGALYLLEAWKKLGLKEAELLLLGQLDRETEPLFRFYRSDPSIHFMGFTKTLPYYQSGNVFVLPSLEEGSALVGYEALACGLPSIVTFESGSVVEDGREGYVVVSRDADSLAQRLEYLYRNPAVCERMSILARQKAENYSWENYGKNLVSAYEKIVGCTQ
ncbi:MAG: glycosyltransferase family 4 protein [Patescibacteria group bacterium]|nr:glycosyltransferase family 4 protein [Patescibacteria group bacterium]